MKLKWEYFMAWNCLKLKWFKLAWLFLTKKIKNKNMKLNTDYKKEELEEKIKEIQEMINGILDKSRKGFILFGELKNNNFHTTGFIQPELNKEDILNSIRDTLELKVETSTGTTYPNISKYF